MIEFLIWFIISKISYSESFNLSFVQSSKSTNIFFPYFKFSHRNTNEIKFKYRIRLLGIRYKIQIKLINEKKNNNSTTIFSFCFIFFIITHLQIST